MKKVDSSLKLISFAPRLARRFCLFLGLVTFTVTTLSCDDSSSASTVGADVGQFCLSHSACADGLECVDAVCRSEGWFPGGDQSSTGTNSDLSSTQTSTGSHSETTATTTTNTTTGTSTPTHTTGTTTATTTTNTTTTTATTTETTTTTTSEVDACAGVPSGFHGDNPYDRSMADVVAAGQVLYMNNSCSACHGANGEGVSGLGSALNDATAAAWPDCRYRWKISVGVKNTSMQPYSDKLIPDEQYKVIAFLRSLQP